jgi:curved DNA-binding protein CbpA
VPDDLYGLIGVGPDATTDEIRDQYRARRSELDATGTEQSRADAAALNRAWNILSDPYQRGRYDAQREANGAEEVDPDDVEVLDDAASNGNGQAPKRRKLFEPADTATRPPRGANPRERLPKVEVPAGMTLAQTRPRITAMSIDLLVLLTLFIGYQFTLFPLDKHFYPKEAAAVTAAEHAQTRADNAVNDANTKLSDAKKSGTAAQQAAAQAQLKAAQTAQTKANDNLNSAQKKLSGFNLAYTILFFLIGLAYLVVPSARNGQTFGKRVQHIRVVNVDGSPIGWSGAMRRYGTITAVTLLLYVACLRQFAALIVVIGLVGWTRNPDRQGMHDRFAKTIVVDAD